MHDAVERPLRDSPSYGPEPCMPDAICASGSGQASHPSERAAQNFSVGTRSHETTRTGLHTPSCLCHFPRPQCKARIFCSNAGFRDMLTGKEKLAGSWLGTAHKGQYLERWCKHAYRRRQSMAAEPGHDGLEMS